MQLSIVRAYRVVMMMMMMTAGDAVYAVMRDAYKQRQTDRYPVTLD